MKREINCRTECKDSDNEHCSWVAMNNVGRDEQGTLNGKLIKHHLLMRTTEWDDLLAPYLHADRKVWIVQETAFFFFFLSVQIRCICMFSTTGAMGNFPPFFFGMISF